MNDNVAELRTALDADAHVTPNYTVSRERQHVVIRIGDDVLRVHDPEGRGVEVTSRRSKTIAKPRK